MSINDQIFEVVNQYLQKPHRSGPDNVMAICPFHSKSDGSEEKHPSFAMSLVNGLWFCHACQAKGNLYTFLRDIGLERHEITTRYQTLIHEANNNSPAPKNPINHSSISSELMIIPESFLGLFDYCPTQLLDDGFTVETLRHFDIGYDKWHSKVTYPIRDTVGNLIAISGRKLSGNGPKYKIYDTEYQIWGMPNRLGWNKSFVLWNIHSLYPEIYHKNTKERIVIVEGFKACMWVWQSGITNVVAMLGMYLSKEQQWILERLGSPIYLFLDNNDPGKLGVRKSIEKLRKSLSVKIVNYPTRIMDNEDAQPDSCTKEEIIRQVNNAIDCYECV